MTPGSGHNRPTPPPGPPLAPVFSGLARKDRNGEARLVAEVAGGSLQAFRQLYRRLSPIVFSVAVQITGREEDAEEVLVDSFHQVWTQAAQYDASRASVRGWLLNIARSRAIDLIRSRRRWQKRKETAAETGASFSGAVSPEAEAMRSQWRDRLVSVIGTLPPDQRRAVELAYFEGLTHSEIAARLGQPLGTVKTRLRLAMEKIRIAVAGVDEKAT